MPREGASGELRSLPGPAGFEPDPLLRELEGGLRPRGELLEPSVGPPDEPVFRVDLDRSLRVQPQAFDEVETRGQFPAVELAPDDLAAHRDGEVLEGLAASGVEPAAGGEFDGLGLVAEQGAFPDQDAGHPRMIVGVEQGKQFVPDPVAEEAGIVVGGVVAPANPPFAGGLLELTGRESQQRTNQVQGRIGGGGINPPHAAQAPSSGTAEEAHQHQFGLVVRVMARRDAGSTVVAGGPRQKRMAKTARRGFEGFTRTGAGTNVGGVLDEWKPPIGGGRRDEVPVGVGFGAAELVMEVAHDQAPGRSAGGRAPIPFGKGAQKEHGIATARNGDKAGGAGGEKRAGREGVVELGRERGHPEKSMGIGSRMPNGKFGAHEIIRCRPAMRSRRASRSAPIAIAQGTRHDFGAGRGLRVAAPPGTVGAVQRRVLIAGCGYVGTALGRRLVAEGHRVYGVRRPGGVPDGLRASGIEPLFADLSRGEDLKRLPRDWDWVVQCAAPGGGGHEGYVRTYREITLRLRDWLGEKPPAAWVYVGSTGVYGQSDGSEVDEDSPTEPASVTGRLLVEAECLLVEAAAQGLPVMRLRAAGIYGPDRNRIAALQRGELRGRGAGDRFMNLIHRDDLVTAVARVLDRGRAGRVYNAADGMPVLERDFLAWLRTRLGLPEPSGEGGREPAPAGRGRRETNKRIVARRLRTELGWEPRYPGFREGYDTLLPGPGTGGSSGPARALCVGRGVG